MRGHGNDKYNFSGKIRTDFSSTVWYKQMPEWFFQKLDIALRNTIDYPHPSAAGLVEQIAVFHDVTAKNICVTNGSVEGMYLIAQAFSGEKSTVICPSFTEYENACERYNHSLNFISNKTDWQNQKFEEGLVWFGNPNNPDGKTISKDEIECLLSANPKTIFVIDEAFADVCFDFESAISLFEKHQNFILLRSFTKAFAIPGMRLGYVVAPDWIIEKLNKFTIPWSVNSIAIDAGKILIQNYAVLLPNKNEMEILHDFLFDQLCDLPELEVLPSDCNYFLIQLKKGNAADLRNYLAKKKRLLIRDASNFRGLDSNYIRISVQPKKNIQEIISAMKFYFSELS